MKWKIVKLGDVCTFKTGKTPSTKKPEYFNGSINWYTPGDIGSNKYLSQSVRTITDLSITENQASLLPENTLLLTCIGEIGRVGILSDAACSNQQITGLIFDEQILPKYAYYWFISNRNILKDRSNNAVVPILNNAALRDITFKYPPLHIQEQIADTLDKADALRRKDQELLQKYDQLAQAIFYDMFGDPVNNSKVWDLKIFNEVGTLDRGVSKHRPRNAPDLLGGNYPLIQTGDVANSNGYITEFRQTYSDLGLKQSKLWGKGTLCITIAANIAKTGILNFDACFPDSIVGFKPNNLVSANYVRFWLGFLQKILEDSAPESAQKNINLEILRNLKIPVPPIALQESFEQKLGKLLETKDKTAQSSLKGQSFFNNLMNKYFS
jgi:type I restriction enzyme S subunit